MSKDAGGMQQQCLTPPENAAIISRLLDAEAIEKKLALQVVGLQAAMALIAAGVVYGHDGNTQNAIAVLSGGSISILNGALLAWRMSRPAVQSDHEVLQQGTAHQQLLSLYLYAAERFLVVMALLGICLVGLKLVPLPVVGGFVICQATFLAARLLLNKKNFRLR